MQRALLIKTIIIAAVIAAFYGHWWWAGNLPGYTGAMAGAAKEMLRGLVTVTWLFTLFAALALPLKKERKPSLTSILIIISIITGVALCWAEAQLFITHLLVNIAILIFAHSWYVPPAARSGQQL